MNPDTVFEVMAKIKPGDTLCSDLTIVEHGTWFSFFKRSFSGDTRSNTVKIIEDAVNVYCEKKKDVIYLKSKEVTFLEEARIGIKNLAETYRLDKPIQERLKNCHLKLRALITNKQERSSSSDSEEDKNTKSDVLSSDEEEFDVEEDINEEHSDDVPSIEEVIINEKEIKSTERRDSESEKTKKVLSNKECGSSEYIPGSKFENYLKKKNSRRGNVGSNGNIGQTFGRRTSSITGSAVSTRDVGSFRRLPKLHVITMGDVLSKVDILPKNISNPLSSSLSQDSKPRNITWYVENFLRK